MGGAGGAERPPKAALRIRWLVGSLAGAVAVGGALAARGVLRGAARDGGERSAQVEIVRVGGSPPLGVVVLSVPSDEKMVPIFISSGEAGMLQQRREGTARTPDFPSAVLTALGARLERVVLDGQDDPVGQAELRSARGAVSIAGPPGELLAWALGARAPILMTARLLDARGLTREQIEKMAPGLSPPPPASTARQGPTL